MKKDCSRLHSVYAGSGVQLGFHVIGTEGVLSGVQPPGLEADHTPPSSAELNARNCNLTSSHAFMNQRFIKDRGHLCITLFHSA